MMKELDIIYRGMDGSTFARRLPLGKFVSDATKESDSKYILMVDHDDYSYQSDWYEEYGLYLIKSLGIAISPRYLIEGTWNFVDKPQGAGIFYEREKFLDVGGYDETLDYQADLDFYIRYTKKYPITTAYGLIYLWKPGRSRTFSEEICLARGMILNRYGLKDNEVHHFGAYAYL